MGESITTDGPLNVAADETIVQEADALLVRGLLAWHVHVTVTDKRVILVPTSRLERAAGASKVAFWVADISELSWSRLTRVLSIHVGEQHHRLSGGGAVEVHDALVSVRSPDQGEKVPSRHRFERGEKVLLEGQIDVVVRTPLWVSGTARLTTHRLSFQPGGGMQRVFVTSEPIDIPLSEVAGIRVSRGGGGLSVLWAVEPDGGGAPILDVAIEMVRGIVSPLAAALMSMGVEVLPPHALPPETLPNLAPPMYIGAARLGAGAIARSGTVAIGAGGVWMASADFVASLAGSQAEGGPFRDFMRIDVEPVRGHALTLFARGPEQGLSFEFDRVSVEPLAIARLMARDLLHHTLTVDQHGVLDPSDVRNLARMHTTLLPTGRDTRPVQGQSAVRVTRGGRAVRGWLLLLQSGLLFVPGDGRAEDRLYVDGVLIDRAHSGPEDDGVLRVLAERRIELFVLFGGRAAAVSVWSGLWGNLPDLSGVMARFPYVDALIGSIGYIRLKVRQNEVLSRRLVTTTLERGGIGFIVGEHLPNDLRPGVDVEVEVGKEEVVFLFRTHVADVVVRHNQHFLVIGLSSHVVRRDNRRQAFRVALDRPVEARIVSEMGARPHPEVLRGAIADLSWTGIGIRLPASLPVGTLFQCHLELDDATDTYVLEAIFVESIQGSNEHHYGCRFVNLTAGGQDLIQSVVIREQMREVARQELRSEVGSGPLPEHFKLGWLEGDPSLQPTDSSPGARSR